MEYPGTRLTHHIRIAILAVFITAFLVLTPLTIMYTMGYRYDWQNGRRQETGAISIDIEPAATTVYLDSIWLQNKMPVRLKSVPPRPYRIRLSAKGYYDWEKEFDVKNKQTIYIKEISLLKKSEPQFLTAGKIAAMALSFDQRYLAYARSATNSIEIFLYDTNAGTEKLIISIPANRSVKFSWAPRNNYLAITSTDFPGNFFRVIDASNIGRIVDLVDKENSSISKFVWDDLSDTRLYYGVGAIIKSLDPLSGNITTVAKNSYLDWHMENGHLWTVQITTTTGGHKIVQDTLGFAKILGTLDNNYIPAGTNLKILTAAREQILLRYGDQSNLLLVTSHDRVFKLSGDQYLISPYNNWWLIWTPWELWTYTEGSEPYLLNRSGEGIKNVMPMDQHNTLAMAYDKRVTALFPYYLVTNDLINESVGATVADPQNKILYFSAKIGKQEGVWKLQY